MRISREFIDKFIAFAVLIQSCLVIIQQILISVLDVDLPTSTLYRVVLTAIPLTCAIILSFRRNPQLYFGVYIMVTFILSVNIILFPSNVDYLISQSTRFLLPVVIPSALSLITVSRIDVVEDVLYKTSLITSFLALVYVLNFLTGSVVFKNYDMSFSYALLLPMLSLYSKKKFYSVGTSIFLFTAVLAMGSRGAALFFVIYVVYDAIQYNKNYIFPLVLAVSVFILLIPTLVQFLEVSGIHSRTLSFLVNDNITYSSGRDSIYRNMIEVFKDNYILGIGLFGDRYYLDGAYTHNIFLEILLNFGLLLGSAILFYAFSKCIKIYMKLDKRNRNILVKYFLGTIAPLMLSHSYLTSYNFGLFIGIVFLLSRNLKTTYNGVVYL